MPAFVIGDALAVLGAEQQWTLGTEDDLLQGVGEILLMYEVLFAPRREQRGLVGEILQVGTGEPGRSRRELRKAHIARERNLARVHFQDRFPSCPVRQIDDD